MRGEERDMEPVDSGATIYLSAQDTYTPLSSPHRRWGRLLSRTGLKDINKSKEKMRCEKKTESIIPSKLKVLGRGWQETGGGRWRLGWFPVDSTTTHLRRPRREEASCQLLHFPEATSADTHTTQPGFGGEGRGAWSSEQHHSPRWYFLERILN